MLPVMLLAAAGLAGNGLDFDAATRALAAQIRKGDWAGAAATARRIDRAVATNAPLEIVKLEVLAGPPQGLGMYTPLVDGSVRNEELFVYAQVRNHGLREVHGFHELHLVSDIVVLGGRGQELARDEGFGESRFTARAVHRDTFVVIAVRTTGLESGSYRFRLILHDKIGKKTAHAEAPFRVP